VDVAFVISRRLEELGYVQKDLARAAQVTESYISQLLTRKKPLPAPNRTDIYGRMDEYLKLPGGQLARLAQLQRLERLRRHVGEEPTLLPGKVREPAEAPGFREFLGDRALSGTASDEELGFLRALAVGSKQPTALYYYRELQNLRDPLHFRRQ
jgi:transcriptional regulator with XRE-family HTH domain